MLPSWLGEPFDVRQLESIRSSIARSFRNSGYPTVQASHVAFVADTIGQVNEKQVALTVELFLLTTPMKERPSRISSHGLVMWIGRAKNASMAMFRVFSRKS